MKENDAYGKFHSNSLPSCGQFSTPVVRPNVAYGVTQRDSYLDCDGYELIDTVRSYATPHPPSLGI